ncbi:MAG: hypothetical protein BWY38_03093 [Ignavibacteria bacterium ADurb.Bin266]|nr:MAG: hypothetical protein BWY38_03093 [Ignavibacteria bacterium ADurb.Bin266]
MLSKRRLGITIPLIKHATLRNKDSQLFKYLKETFRTDIPAAIIFIFSLAINTVIALKMNYLSVCSDEFGVAGIAAFYAGHDWSAAFSNITAYFGFIQALFYAPLFKITDDPVLLYHSMLITNGIMISLIPVIVYKVSGLLGVTKTYHRIMLAVICGFYSTYIAHSKFIWNESISCLIPWITLYVLLIAVETKNYKRKLALSIIIGFCTVFSYFAHPRMIGLSAVVIIIIYFSKYILKKKLIPIVPFTSSIIIFFISGTMLKKYLVQNLWNTSVLNNTFESSIKKISGHFSVSGLYNLISTLLGHLYYFITSTWGIGVLVFVICIPWIMLIKRNNKVQVSIIGSQTNKFKIFTAYSLLLTASTFIISAMFKFSSTVIGYYQDIPMFGRYIDAVIPVGLLFIFICLIKFGLKFKNVAIGIAIISAVYIGFYFTTLKIVENAPRYRMSPIIGIQPLRFNQSIIERIDFNTIIMTGLSIITVMIIVAGFCFIKKKNFVINAILSFYALLSIYSSFFIITEYLPVRAAEGKEYLIETKQLSQYLCNEIESPKVIALNISKRQMTNIQFYNKNLRIYPVVSIKEIPENSIIVTVTNGLPSETAILKSNKLQRLGQTEKYTVYAYGEKAIEYSLSKILK